MKKAALLIFLVLVIISPLLLYNNDDPYRIANYPPENGTIVAFGDSLVEGVGASQGNDFVSQLGERLDKEIINLGESGDTTKSAIPRLEEVFKYDPGVVIILLGGNDYIKKIPQEETEANLRNMMQLFQEQGSVVVLLGVRGGLLRDQRGDMYKDLSEEMGAVFVDDVLDGIFAKPDLMSDAIHPNDAGHALIAEKVYQAMKFLFE